ncbi:MAG: hypothetical protein ACPGRW_06325 [Flavobacteriaceae bacterium]
MDIRHYINKKDFGEPLNWQDVEITKEWINNGDSETLNVSELTFNLEANEYLQKRILDGIRGGVGIFEGEPYTIEMGNPSAPLFTFDGYLDFTQNLSSLGKEEITCSLKKRKSENWLNDVADGFSFASLYDEGIVLQSDFVKVPYVINFIPDGLQLVTLSMSIYMMTKELIENVEKISESIADIVNAGTPVVGVSVGVGAGVVTAWDIGDYVLAALKVIARIVYTIAIVIAITKLIDSLFSQLLPAKREHLGMTFKRMFERGCQKLGLRFESSIQELEWVYIPRKDRKGGSRGETGYPVNSGALYLFGDLIRVMKRYFNADYRIINGVFKFERIDKFKVTSPFKIPETFNNQERLLQQFTLNTDEIISNYNIFYSYDTQDQNTMDNQEGAAFQVITEPVVKNNLDLVNIKNLTQIDLPFTIGRDKQSLTTVEEVFKTLASIVDGLTGIFGGGTNFSSKINSRVGSLLLSSHFTSLGKVVAINGSTLARNQRQVLDCKNLWENYHYINSFAEYKGEHNQYFRYLEQPVPMRLQDFVLLLDNNIIQDAEGNEIIIEKCTYNQYRGEALIDYRVKRKYTNNLKLRFVK